MIQTILYADDQVIVAESEDELQIAVNELNKIVKKYDMKISTIKTKTKGLCGKNIQRVKIEIEGKIIEQVSSFNYLGNFNIK
jgi:beta-xylosidase